MSLPVSDRAPELFPGFEPEDFAAFLRHAWTDPSKTPARKAAMRRLDSLVHAPFSALKAAHPELDLVWVRSATEPCTENDGRVQSGLLALVRGSTQRRWAEHEAERRRELRAHAGRATTEAHPSIFARLDADGLFVGAGLPRTAAPDANAFLETLRSRAGRAAFQQVLGALPETFVSGDGGPNAVSVRSMDDGILRLAADAFARGLGWWVIGRRFSREEALDMPSILELELDGIAEGAVQAYRALALRPPASVLKPRLKGARPAGRGRGDARRASGGKPKKEKARTAAAPGGPPPKKKARKPRAEPRPLDRPAVAGDRVKLIRGPFKGRLGTVLDLREGEAQVRVGLLPVWFACADMIVLPPREPRK